MGKGAGELSQKVRASAPGAWPPPPACPAARTPCLTDPAQEGRLCPPVLGSGSSSQPGPWASGSPTVEWRRQHEKGLWKVLRDTDRAEPIPPPNPRRHSAPQPACDTEVPEGTEQVPGVCRPPALSLSRGASAWEPSPCVCNPTSPGSAHGLARAAEDPGAQSPGHQAPDAHWRPGLFAQQRACQTHFPRFQPFLNQIYLISHLYFGRGKNAVSNLKFRKNHHPHQNALSSDGVWEISSVTLTHTGTWPSNGDRLSHRGHSMPPPLAT